MATNNAVDNKSLPLSTTVPTIDPGASGDSYVQYNINTSSKFRIGVDDTDDSFRISQGSALGTNDSLVVSATGVVNKPLQPCFIAYLSSSDADETGDGTSYQLGTAAMTEITDQNGDFNTNGTFQAPVTGTYYLTTAIELADINSLHTDGNCTITTSNATYISSDQNPGYMMDANSELGIVMSIICDMDASDTATVSVVVDGDTKTVDINGGAAPVTTFAGYLMG